MASKFYKIGDIPLQKPLREENRWKYKEKSKNNAVIIGVTVLLCPTATEIFAMAANGDGATVESGLKSANHLTLSIRKGIIKK